jgi:hypothetical protein
MERGVGIRGGLVEMARKEESVMAREKIIFDSLQW